MNFFSQSSNTLIPKCEGKNMFDLAGTGVQASQLSVNMGLCGKHLTILLLLSIFYFRLEKKKWMYLRVWCLLVKSLHIPSADNINPRKEEVSAIFTINYSVIFSVDSPLFCTAQWHLFKEKSNNPIKEILALFLSQLCQYTTLRES